jgi:group I intron endonuclease
MRIYIIINKLTNHRYIGMTSKTLSERWSLHKADARRNKPWHLHRAIRKYGEDNFVIELLEEAPASSFEDLGKIETSWIKKLKPEYNMTAGGEGHAGIPMLGEKNGMFNKNHSEESKEKMRMNRKGKGGKTGEFNPRYGKPGTFLGNTHTEETKLKMRKPKSVPRQRVVCEHCGKEVTINTIGQHKRAYHNE